MRPWGSHPFVDPMWSNDHLRIVHDGAEATRLRKVEAISDYGPAMKYLRVCYHHWAGRYNCGHCEKCLRTLVALRLCGADGRAESFETGLDLRLVSRLLLHPAVRPLWDEMRRVAADRGDRALAGAIAEALNKRLTPRRLLRLARHGVGRLVPDSLQERLSPE